MKNVPRFECLTREEIKNTMARNEQGRSLKKKNLEMEYPWLMMKKGFEWMFNNFHWVVIGMCVGLAGLACWLIKAGVIV